MFLSSEKKSNASYRHECCAGQRIECQTELRMANNFGRTEQWMEQDPTNAFPLMFIKKPTTDVSIVRTNESG